MSPTPPLPSGVVKRTPLSPTDAIAQAKSEAARVWTKVVTIPTHLSKSDRDDIESAAQVTALFDRFCPVDLVAGLQVDAQHWRPDEVARIRKEQA